MLSLWTIFVLIFIFISFFWQKPIEKLTLKIIWSQVFLSIVETKSTYRKKSITIGVGTISRDFLTVEIVIHVLAAYTRVRLLWKQKSKKETVKKKRTLSAGQRESAQVGLGERLCEWYPWVVITFTHTPVLQLSTLYVCLPWSISPLYFRPYWPLAYDFVCFRWWCYCFCSFLGHCLCFSQLRHIFAPFAILTKTKTSCVFVYQSLDHTVCVY